MKHTLGPILLKILNCVVEWFRQNLQDLSSCLRYLTTGSWMVRYGYLTLLRDKRRPTMLALVGNCIDMTLPAHLPFYSPWFFLLIATRHCSYRMVFTALWALPDWLAAVWITAEKLAGPCLSAALPISVCRSFLQVRMHCLYSNLLCVHLSTESLCVHCGTVHYVYSLFAEGGMR